MAFLKRPFGIHRAFYSCFPDGYLRSLSLPPSLSVVLHTVVPERFEIFYKVLDEGVGTKEMSLLKKDDRVHVLGPLGKPFKVRSLRDKGVDEVHVIGGGVGMAPLIFFVQALRYYAFHARAFIGVGRLEALKYEKTAYDLKASFDEKTEDAYIYVDDLLDTGIEPEEIHLSCDIEAIDKMDRRIPDANFHFGIVSDQYAEVLSQDQELLEKVRNGRIAAFTCGPMPMMQSVFDVTKTHGIPLKVLMEKRMACGIGVCLSCVCKTKQKEAEEYTRVCTDGPMFNAEDIVWNLKDLK